jgi:hypothetical protein
MAKGLPSSAKRLINSVVENLFDRMALNLLGDIPELKNRKVAFFSTSPNLGLANLFVQVLNRNPSQLEADILKGLLTTAHTYLESLKNKTKASIETEIDAYIKDKNTKKEPISELDVHKSILEGLIKAKNHIKTIADTESTKTRNIAQTMQITRVAADMNVSDPNVMFICVHDNKLCEECERLHLMEDKKTPRVWKLSELGYGYHKKGDPNPKVGGLHPNERCTLTFLAPGYGFVRGKVSYISPDHDEYVKQRS